MNDEAVREAVIPLVAALARVNYEAARALKAADCPPGVHATLARITGLTRQALDEHEAKVGDGLLEGGCWFVGDGDPNLVGGW